MVPFLVNAVLDVTGNSEIDTNASGDGQVAVRSLHARAHVPTRARACGGCGGCGCAVVRLA